MADISVDEECCVQHKKVMHKLQHAHTHTKKDWCHFAQNKNIKRRSCRRQGWKFHGNLQMWWFLFCLLDTQGLNQNRFSFISLLEKLGRFESTKGNSTRHSVSWKVLFFFFCHDQYLYGELNKRKAHLKQWREKAFVWSWKPTSHPPVESDSEFAFVPSVFFLNWKRKFFF